MAFGATDPWWSAREDMRTALICAVIANVHRSKGRPFEVSDFLLKFGAHPKQTAQQIKTALGGWIDRHNRSVKHGAAH